MSEPLHELSQEEYQQMMLEHNNFKHDIEDLKKDVAECKQQQKTISDLTRSVDRMTITMETMVKSQDELREDIKVIKEAPIEDYKHYKRLVIGCVITTVLGAVLGAVLALIIKGG